MSRVGTIRRRKSVSGPSGVDGPVTTRPVEELLLKSGGGTSAGGDDADEWFEFVNEAGESTWHCPSRNETRKERPTSEARLHTLAEDDDDDDEEEEDEGEEDDLNKVSSSRGGSGSNHANNSSHGSSSEAVLVIGGGDSGGGGGAGESGSLAPARELAVTLPGSDATQQGTLDAEQEELLSRTVAATAADIKNKATDDDGDNDDDDAAIIASALARAEALTSLRGGLGGANDSAVFVSDALEVVEEDEEPQSPAFSVSVALGGGGGELLPTTPHGGGRGSEVSSDDDGGEEVYTPSGLPPESSLDASSATSTTAPTPGAANTTITTAPSPKSITIVSNASVSDAAAAAASSAAPGSSAHSLAPPAPSSRRRDSFQYAPSVVRARRKSHVFQADKGLFAKAGICSFQGYVKLGNGLLSGANPRRIEVNVLRQSFAIIKDGKSSKRTEYRAQDVLRFEKSARDIQKLFVLFIDSTLQTLTILCPSAGERERLFCALYAMFFDSGNRMGQYSSPVSVWCGTWNMGNAAPPLDGMASFLPPNAYDIYAVAVQECSYTFADPVTGIEVACDTRDAWYDYVARALGPHYVVLGAHSLWDIRLVVAVRACHSDKVTNIEFAKVATGLANLAGNKGGVVVSFDFLDSTFAFVGSHLAAHQNKIQQRNNNYSEIVAGAHLGKNKDCDIVNMADFVFWMGDLNYRIDGLDFSDTKERIERGLWDNLLAHDQLRRVMGEQTAFVGFVEGAPNFPCTYRYKRGVRDYDYTPTKPRIPSWCDRILYRVTPNQSITLKSYESHDDIMTSDHSPVSAVFECKVLIPFIPFGWNAPMIPCRMILHDLRVINMRPSSKPDIYIKFSAPYLRENSWKTSVIKENDSPLWDFDVVLEPFATDKEYLERQKLQCIVMDARSDVSLGETSLALDVFCEACGSPVAFRCGLIKSGLPAGQLTGTLRIVWEGGDPSELHSSLLVETGDD